LLSAAVLFPLAAAAGAATTAARLAKYQQPVYPENLNKTRKQGNVVLVGRIDTKGMVQDLRPLVTSHEAFVAPAMAAVRAWKFEPATRDGKAVEVAANIGVRFRLESPQRGEIPAPILGDLVVSPADASGKRSAPEGFPLQRGKDGRLRIEALLDVPPQPQPRPIRIRAEAVSPKGAIVPLYDDTVSVPAKKGEVRLAFSAPVGGTWEDGVWALRITADGASAGGGQFWLAGDPTRFDFSAAMPKK
jgi:TonB family protein